MLFELVYKEIKGGVYMLGDGVYFGWFIFVEGILMFLFVFIVFMMVVDEEKSNFVFLVIGFVVVVDIIVG